MITYIRGILEGMEEDKVIVDVGGVGYGIYMSGTAMGSFRPVGSKVKIHTYLNVKGRSDAAVWIFKPVMRFLCSNF